MAGAHPAAIAKQEKLVRPFLKWAGGKRQLVPELLRYVPKQYNSYYEPFVGAGALLLALQPERAFINDRNRELIDCYEVIRDTPEDLIAALQEHRNEADYYYAVRSWDREVGYERRSKCQRAARILFLNKTCYNGLFRVNSKGQFNAPFGRYKNPNISNENVLRAVSRYLNTARVAIASQDFDEAVRSATAGDFVYCDPPYDPVSATASFTGYAAAGFDRDEQRRLKETFDKLAARGCKVLLSNACTDFILDLYREYKIVRVAAKRAINSNASKRGKIEEVLVMNYSLASPDAGS